jgi:transcriptional regulator with XRE-family HTH domain
MDWNSCSNTAIVQEIGKRIKAYRIEKRFTQQDLAIRAGVSLFTLTKIERGKPVSIIMLLAVLRGLRLLDNLELFLPEISISPIKMLELRGNKPQRVRPEKQK